MEGFEPAEGNQTSQLDFRAKVTVVTPLGMGVEKQERADLPGSPTEVRISFLLGMPPGVVTEEFVVRMEQKQAHDLASALTGGIQIARAGEIPKP